MKVDPKYVIMFGPHPVKEDKLTPEVMDKLLKAVGRTQTA